MKFKKEFMQEVAYDEVEGVKIIENNIIDNSRWSTIHKIVFSFNGKFYESNYSIGATEQQDESPYHRILRVDWIGVGRILGCKWS